MSSIIFMTHFFCQESSCLSERYGNTPILFCFFFHLWTCAGVQVPLAYIGKCPTLMTSFPNLTHVMYRSYVHKCTGVPYFCYTDDRLRQVTSDCLVFECMWTKSPRTCLDFKCIVNQDSRAFIAERVHRGVITNFLVLFMSDHRVTHNMRSCWVELRECTLK